SSSPPGPSASRTGPGSRQPIWPRPPPSSRSIRSACGTGATRPRTPRAGHGTFEPALWAPMRIPRQPGDVPDPRGGPLPRPVARKRLPSRSGGRYPGSQTAMGPVHLGNAVYMVAALAGLTDVDAITLSMAEYARSGDPHVATSAIVLATL